MRTSCITALIILLLNACGLKAPLYLPEKIPQPQQAQDEEKQR